MPAFATSSSEMTRDGGKGACRLVSVWYPEVSLRHAVLDHPTPLHVTRSKAQIPRRQGLCMGIEGRTKPLSSSTGG